MPSGARRKCAPFILLRNCPGRGRALTPAWWDCYKVACLFSGWPIQPIFNFRKNTFPISFHVYYFIFFFFFNYYYGFNLEVGSLKKMHLSVFFIYLTASFVKCVKDSVFSTDPSSVFFRNPSFSPPFTFATCYSLLYELRRMLADSQTGRVSGFPTANRVSEEARRFLWPYLGQHRRCVRPEEHFPGPKMICCLPSMTRKISERRQHRSWLHHAGLRGEKPKPAHKRENWFTGSVTHAADN